MAAPQIVSLTAVTSLANMLNVRSRRFQSFQLPNVTRVLHLGEVASQSLVGRLLTRAQ